jgi:hypothetical protein
VARLNDLTQHGGTIVEGSDRIFVNGVPAAFRGGMTVCPMLTGGSPGVPHVGGPIVWNCELELNEELEVKPEGLVPCLDSWISQVKRDAGIPPEGYSEADFCENIERISWRFWGYSSQFSFCRNPSRTLAKPVTRGSRVLEVDGSGIEIGDGVVIGSNPDLSETARVVGKGSIILDRPLKNSYPAGTLVTRVPDDYADLVPPPAVVVDAGNPNEEDTFDLEQDINIEESEGISKTTILVLIMLIVAVAFVILLIKKVMSGAIKIVVLLVVLLLIAMGAMYFSGGDNAQQTPTQVQTFAPATTAPTPEITLPPTTLPATALPSTHLQTTLPPETLLPTTTAFPITTSTLPPMTIATTTASTTTSTITLTTTTTIAVAKPTLELVDETILDNVEDKFWLGGNVRNNGETEVFSVRVRLTLYNEMGSILQTINSVPIDRIGPGKTVVFNTIKSDKITIAVARYEVTIHTGE